MSHPFPNQTRTDQPPAEFLAGAGRVFAVFGDKTQDSGNVSYGLDVGGRRFFVKTAGAPGDTRWFLTHAERVALLRNAANLYRESGRPPMAPLVGVVESPHGPMLVYEWAAGELLKRGAASPTAPSSAHQRFRELPAQEIAGVLDELYALHAHLSEAGWVPVDFYDGCLIYDFAARRLHVVDLDHYHRRPFVNEMGRMFGSSRFMAPEEFERGAMIDARTTVFTMGRAATVFLSDGSLDRPPFRGSDGLYDVVRQACQPDPAERFKTVGEFYRTWRAVRQGSDPTR